MSILQALLESGNDVNRSGPPQNLLEIAAPLGDLELAGKLMEAGVNGALAINHLSKEGQSLPDALFKEMLKLLLENARPLSKVYVHPLLVHPLIDIVTSRKAIQVCP